MVNVRNVDQGVFQWQGRGKTRKASWNAALCAPTVVLLLGTNMSACRSSPSVPHPADGVAIQAPDTDESGASSSSAPATGSPEVPEGEVPQTEGADGAGRPPSVTPDSLT